MASPSLTYTLTNGSTADATQVMQNLNDLLNGITDGTKDLSISALTCAGSATFNGNVTLGNSSVDTVTITATPTFSSPVTFSDEATFNGNVTFGNASSDTITLTGSLASSVPIGTNNTYDVGSSTLGLRKIYLGNAGAGATCSVVSASHATTREYTVPDCSAAANFLMSQGSQTAAGAMTWTGQQTIQNDVLGHASYGFYGASTSKLLRAPAGIRSANASFSSSNGESGTNKDIASIVLANYGAYLVTISCAADSSNYVNTVVCVTRGLGAAGAGNVSALAKAQTGNVNTGTISTTSNGSDTILRIPMTNTTGQTLTGRVDVLCIGTPPTDD